MSDHIYLIDHNRELRTMSESQFSEEDIFQAMLEAHPELLITGGDPPRWLLITREMPVADTDSGADRWYLDHLFLDQFGIPTLVEVKRSTDTRIRREWVGQMLDYAANAVTHWSVDRIRAELEKQCERDGTDPTALVCECLQLSEDGDAQEGVEKYWNDVKTNLEAEKLRLLFVADKIPSEVQRVIEFLNNQMRGVVVLGVELKLYEPDDSKVNRIKALVPRLVGQTEKARQRKGSTQRGPARPWDKATFLDEIDSNTITGGNARTIAESLIDWMGSYGELDFRDGAMRGTLRSFVIYRDRKISPLCVCTDGRFYVSIWWLRDAMGAQELMRKFSEHLNRIDVIDIPADWRPGEYWYDLPLLADAVRFEQLKAAIQWLCSQFAGDSDSETL